MRTIALASEPTPSNADTKVPSRKILGAVPKTAYRYGVKSKTLPDLPSPSDKVQDSDPNTDPLSHADYLEIAQSQIAELTRLIELTETDYKRFCAAPDTPGYIELRSKAYSLLEDMRRDRQKYIDVAKVFSKSVALQELRKQVEALDDSPGRLAPFRRLHRRKTHS